MIAVVVIIHLPSVIPAMRTIRIHELDHDERLIDISVGPRQIDVVREVERFPRPPSSNWMEITTQGRGSITHIHALCPWVERRAR